MLFWAEHCFRWTPKKRTPKPKQQHGLPKASREIRSAEKQLHAMGIGYRFWLSGIEPSKSLSWAQVTGCGLPKERCPQKIAWITMQIIATKLRMGMNEDNIKREARRK